MLTGRGMIRALVLAIMCLLCMGAALALKPISRVVPAAALPASAAVATTSDDSAPFAIVNSSSKADKLSIAPSLDAAKQLPVQTIKIEPVQAEVQAQEKSVPKAREVVSWHWHAGSKIQRRTNP
jgi:hypothetical protein